MEILPFLVIYAHTKVHTYAHQKPQAGHDLGLVVTDDKRKEIPK